MTTKPITSLEKYLRGQATRWAMIGFVVTLVLAIPCVLYSAKLASERQLLVMAKSAARAFRPMILEDDTRDAEFQMRTALDLSNGESAIVRDANLNSIYPIEESDKTPHCRKPNAYCWSPGFRSVSLLYPIFFDSQKPDVLYGYLELTMKPTLDWTTLSILAFLLLGAFIGQAFGLSSALAASTRQVTNKLTSWADYLRKNPAMRREDHQPVPFVELQPMQEAIDGLYLEIDKLRQKSAQDGKTEGQFSLLREVSHDLRTPHSLLAKNFALHLDTLNRTGKPDAQEVAKIKNNLKRMGELLRQVRVIPLGQTAGAFGTNAASDIASEARSIVEDLQTDPDTEAKRVAIVGHFPDRSPAMARVSTIALYRILENLVRNAVEAVEPERGRVIVSVEAREGKPRLTVWDNGPGIPAEIRHKVLSFDFTTKPARGTGLGLGIVDQICKEFGARLHFESIVGQGTTFAVIFEPVSALESRAKPRQEVSHVEI